VKGPGGTILARVVDSSGAPLEGAILDAGGAPSVSDATGEVALRTEGGAGPPVDVRVRAEGYVPHRERVRVPGDRPAHLGRIVLEPAGAVRGRVVDEDGRPVAEAPVSIEALGSRWLGFRHHPLEEARYLGSLLDRMQVPAPGTTTGPDGTFRVAGLAAGYVRVWAGADGVFYDYSAPLAVRPGADSEVPELVLRAPTEVEIIAGQVVGGDGLPVPGAPVEAARRSLRAAFFRGESVVFRATADEYGRFELALDPTARYDVAARDPRGVWRPTVDSPHVTGERDVLVRLAEWRHFELELDGPAAGDTLEIELVDARRNKRLVPETLAVELPRVRAPAVPFFVRVRAPGFALVELGPYEPDRVPPVLHAGMPALDGPRGRVALEDGAPVPGAAVLLLRALDDGQVRTYPARSAAQRAMFTVLAEGKAVCRATTDAAGEFVLPDATGSFYLRVEAHGRAPALIGPFALDGTPVEPFEIELGHGGTLAGHVLPGPGQDPAGTIVGLTAGDGRLRSQRVTSEGEFRFEHLAPGPYQVRRLSRETAEPGWNRIQTRAQRASRDGVAWDCEVLEGMVTTYDLAPAERPCTVSGHFLIDGLAPGPWHAHLVRIDAEGGAGQRTSTAIDHEGRFELSASGAGRYALELWNSGYRPLFVQVRDELELRAGRVRWQFDLISASLSGVGAAPDDGLVHQWEGGGHLTVTTHLSTDADGRFEATRVPAGASSLERGGGRILELSLPAGIDTQLELGD
jgi:protocatechuate 3,4-dioxygenase beta subunit